MVKYDLGCGPMILLDVNVWLTTKAKMWPAWDEVKSDIVIKWKMLQQKSVAASAECLQ